MDLSNIINKRYALKNLSDEEFEKNLDSLAEQLVKYDYTFSYTNDQLVKDFNNLRDFTTDSMSIAATVRSGMKICEHFMQNVWDVENWKGDSFAKKWNDKEVLKKVLIWNRKSHSTPYISELRRGIYFTTSLPKTTMFRPTLSKLICDHYTSQVVLDPCCGWGGRMLGVACNPNRKYIGFEPNTTTFNNLLKMKDFFKLKNVEIYCQPAEIGISTIQESVDCVLTSPPYFNLEVYSAETTQSVSKDTSYMNWRTHFLEKVIQDSLKLLKEGGVSCWNVANGATNEKFNLIDDVKEIHEKLGYRYLSEFFVSNNKRPGHKQSEKNKDVTKVYISKTVKIEESFSIEDLFDKM
jgi:16S rRNA G966 N2-methylase RsmD